MGDTMNSTATNASDQGEIPCSNDAQFWLDLGRAVGDDDKMNPCVDIPSIVIVDSSSTSAPLTEESEAPATVAYKTFYSCFGDSISSDTNGASSLATDAIEVKLTYDYELYTSSSLLNNDILTSLSNDMTYDLADRYGLVDCSFDSRMTKRRSLRSLKKGDVIALDSMPLDKSLADKYECENQSTTNSSNTICTPIRGSMTAWLPKTTTNTIQIKSELLMILEDGMISNSYTNEDVIKVVYVGKRASGTTGSSNTITESNDSSNAVVGSQNSKSTNSSPLIVIGVSLFFVAIALIVILVMLNRRKRRRKYFSDGPTDMGYANNNSSLAVQAALADRQQFASRDPDDIQLLPSMDKIDMRSVHSTSTDTETENYADENYANGVAGSELAAMGMASTLATQSFNAIE